MEELGYMCLDSVYLYKHSLVAFRWHIFPFEALLSYTKNAAQAILESDDYGTLEPGKVADFFTSNEDFFSLKPNEVVDFRPDATYYKGKAYVKKKGTVSELIKMMLTKPKLI